MVFFETSLKIKKVLLGLISLLGITPLYSQEFTIPVNTQYLGDNPFSLAPTYAGIGDRAKIRLNGLTQWVGIKDAPISQSFSGDFRLGNRSGLGLIMYNDKNGNTLQQGAKLAFAHHLILDPYKQQYLSFGVSYNLNHFRIDVSKFDPNIPDPGVLGNLSILNHNFDVGVLYRQNSFYANLTISNILDKKLDDFIGIEPAALRGFQVYTGYIWKEDRRSNFEIEPSAFYQHYYSDGRSSTDLNVKFRFLEYEDYYWAGISYRFLNDQFLNPINVGPMIGFRKSDLYFAYSYQLSTSKLIAHNTGTHMITLGLDLFQGISNCPCTMTLLP